MSQSPTVTNYRETIDQIRLDVIKAMALRAALQLDVFTPLEAKPLTAAELGAKLRVKPRRLELLLYQLVASEFLTVYDGKFSNTDLSSKIFIKNRPDYYGGIHGLWTEMFSSMLHTAESINTNTARAKIDFNAMSQAELGTFLKGLHGMAEAAGLSLAKRPEFSEVRQIADIGGGSGGVACGLCKGREHLLATVIDLPSIVPIAEEMAIETGLSDRITGSVQDILNAPVEGEFDAVTARALFQVLSEEQCRIAAKNIAAALPSSGKLYIIGHVTDNTHLSPVASVGMNMLFLNIFDEGQAYSEASYIDWLENAGFKDIIREPFVAGNSLIIAEKS